MLISTDVCVHVEGKWSTRRNPTCPTWWPLWHNNLTFSLRVSHPDAAVRGYNSTSGTAEH